MVRFLKSRVGQMTSKNDFWPWKRSDFFFKFFADNSIPSVVADSFRHGKDTWPNIC